MKQRLAHFRVAGLLALALVLSGCAHVLTVTTLNADGSYQRREEFTAPASAKGFNSVFHFRAEKDGVTYEKKDGDVGAKLVVTRQGSPGVKEPIDIVVVGDDGKPIMNSQVSVTKKENGDILYTERLHWLGPPSSFDLEEYFADQDAIRKALPPAYRSQKTVVALTGSSSAFMDGLLLGPPQPNLIKSMINPSLAKLQLVDQIEDFLDLHKQTWLPGISDEDENRLAQSLLSINLAKHNGAVHKTRVSPPDPSLVPALDPLAYVVVPPGKVVETNGSIAGDGRVYWGLIPLATAKHDMVLTVLCRPAP